jgi:hypothetical protein
MILSSVHTLFLGFHGYPLLERLRNHCLKKLASASLPADRVFSTPTIIEDLLSSLYMFDIEG